jgi:predicted GIY-YIG superfamily endonuclease
LSFWVYVLRWSDGSYYTGHTDNLEKRIVKHQAGEFGGYTSTRRPVTLLFSQEFQARDQSLMCEMQIKGWSRKKKEAMMRGDWQEVSRLARNSSSELKTGPSTGSGRTEKTGAIRRI